MKTTIGSSLYHATVGLLAAQALSVPSLYRPGDLNGDGVVDQSELDTVLANYWPTSPWLQMTNPAEVVASPARISASFMPDIHSAGSTDGRAAATSE